MKGLFKVFQKGHHRHLQTLQGEETKVIVWLFIAYMATFLFTFAPHKTGYWIPFNDVEMSLRSHLYYVCERLRLLIFMYLFYHLFRTFNLKVVFWLQMGYLIDYILFYNDPIFIIKFEYGYVPISYSLFYGLVMTFILIRLLWHKIVR
jgi:hypothetical protein